MDDRLALARRGSGGVAPLGGGTSGLRAHAVPPEPLRGGRKTDRQRASAGLALGTDIDRILGDGLPRGVPHEVFAAHVADSGAAAGFVAGLARLVCAENRKIVWLRQPISERETGGLHAPGLRELGLDPGQLTFVRARNATGILQAGLDAVRCAALGLVVIEIWGDPRPLDLTATRRLALAAEKSGVTPLLLRIAATPRPSVAFTRWQVAAAPSRPLPANAPGRPTFDITLLRNRAGASGQRWRVEWDHERCRFQAAPPLSGGVVSVPVGRPSEATRPVARAG